MSASVAGVGLVCLVGCCKSDSPGLHFAPNTNFQCLFRCCSWIVPDCTIACVGCCIAEERDISRILFFSHCSPRCQWRSEHQCGCEHQCRTLPVASLSAHSDVTSLWQRDQFEC
jgi:hypothetical protein